MAKEHSDINRRKSGRPKRKEAVVTPEMLEEIGYFWLQQVSEGKIAERFGISRATVRYHIERTIRPLWHDRMRARLAEDLAKVALIERTAWERFESAEPGETWETIEKALLDGGRKSRLVRQAVSKVTKTGDVAWLQVVQWCLDYRARVHAHYAPVRHKVDMGGDLRVAGKSPTEVDEMMLQRLLEKIAERRRYRQGQGMGEN